MNKMTSTPVVPLSKKTQWGKWTRTQDNYLLIHDPSGAEYAMSLKALEEQWKRDDFIQNMASKNWISAVDLANLHLAFMEIFREVE